MASKVIVMIFTEENELLRQISVEAIITDHLDSVKKLATDIIIELSAAESHSRDNVKRYRLTDMG